MTTVFQITLKPILILFKSLGLIDISYTVEPTGLITRNIISTGLVFFEIVRMIILLICTYLYWNCFKPELHVLQIIDIIKFWIILIATRLSALWIIKFINGIIEFDRKITPLATNLLITHRSWSKKHWNWIFIIISTYLIIFKSLQFIFFPYKIRQIVSYSLNNTLFIPPFLMDYVVVISSCFFLQNIYVRFQTLNDVWNCLPADLVVVPGQWTHDKIVNVMENTRLLHSELCELLKIFTLGYGPMLLGFFSSSFINILLSFYFIVNNRALTKSHLNKNMWEKIIPLMIHAQTVTFLMSIIIFVSIINEKRLNLMSYLRSYRISSLHFDMKRQIKMFMNQMSACDSDQISAIGFFDINLNLVITIIVLLISGMTTIIQMKDHPVILKFNNNTKSYLEKMYT